MVTVKQLINKLKEYPDDYVVTMSASNYDGPADAYLVVGTDNVLGFVDYYNSDDVELI